MTDPTCEADGQLGDSRSSTPVRLGDDAWAIADSGQ
jgi:hypothetical protein